MSPFSSSCNAQFSPQVTQSWITLHFPSRTKQQPHLAFRSLNTGLFGHRVVHISSRHGTRWCFLRGSRIGFQREVARINHNRKRCTISASWLTSSQIAANAFTWGTIAVLPFYTLMVVAPNARLFFLPKLQTQRTMGSCIPYVLLGVLYAYLLYLSWSPDTLRLMFASKYWLPELPGIARMFSNEVTMASAWIHLLVVDLFAARYFMMGSETRSRRVILFHCAFSSVRLGS